MTFHCSPYSPLILLLFLLPAGAYAAGDDHFGRLFTTPEQRSQMDALRYAEEPEPSHEVLVPEPEKVAPRTTQNPIRLRGIIRRSGAEPVYWINDSNSMQADFLQENITVMPEMTGSDSVEIRLPDATIVPLQVGESYIPESESQSQSQAQPSFDVRTEKRGQ